MNIFPFYSILFNSNTREKEPPRYSGGSLFDMVKYLKINQKIYDGDGGELMRYSLSYPVIEESGEGIAKINEFFRKITLGGEEFCADKLSLICKEQRSETPQTYTPYSYRLSCTVGFEDDSAVSVLISASLKRLGGGGTVGSFETAKVFDKSDGLMLPPIDIIKKYAPDITHPRKYIRKNKLSSVCLCERGVMAMKSGQWILIP